MKFSRAKRRTTSSVCGFSPRFSWITIIPGSFAAVSLRESALNHPRALRVPQPIVRFVRVGSAGLEFELMVFVAQLEDRLVVSNDLNKTILARLIEEKILDPTPAAEFKLRNLDKLADALRGRESDHGTPPSSR